MSSTVGTPNDLSLCQRDEYYYFEDIYFIVEKTIFKIPKHHFEESPHFIKIFDTAPKATEMASPEGNIIKVNRIHRLLDATVDEFRQLLRVLYPRRFDAEELTPSQWLSVLKLSTLWGLDKVRTLAIKNLDALPMSGIKGAVDILVLGQNYGVKQWLLRALRLLAEKGELKESLVDLIGAATNSRLTRLQGMVAGVQWGRKEKGSNEEFSQDEIDRLIKVIFPEVDLPKVVATVGTKRSEAKK